MKRLARHKPWRSKDGRDDFIQRIYGWGPMADITRGFDVRVPGSWGHPQKYFAMSHYGSEQAALDRARAHRDKLLARSGEPERRTGERRHAPFMIKRKKNNTSGMIGITRDRGCWIAWYHPRPGKQVRRAWSMKKYTDEGARQLAILWRADMLNKLRR